MDNVTYPYGDFALGHCLWCGRELPKPVRKNKKWCSDSCGSKASAFRVRGIVGKGILPTRSRCPRIAVVAVLSLTSRGAVILVDGVHLRAVLRFITGIVRAIASLMRLVISVLCNVWRPVSRLVLVVRIAARKCVGVRLMCFALSLSVVPCRGKNTR